MATTRLLLRDPNQLLHLFKRHLKDPREKSHSKRIKAILGTQHEISAYLLLLLFHGPSAERHLYGFMVDSDKARILEKGVEVCGDAEFLSDFAGGFVEEDVEAREGRGFG